MSNLHCYCSEDCRFDSFFGWLRATQHCAWNKWLPMCRWLQSTVNLQSYSNLQSQNLQRISNENNQFQSETVLSKNDNMQIHQYIEMSQDLNPSTCSSLVIFVYWACENHTFNATPTDKLQQHPLVFAMNRIYCKFFL